MNPKVKAFLFGAAEAAGAGAVLGVMTVWGEPGDVILTKAGIVAAASVAIKYGLVYLFAYLRKNVAFRPVWTEEERTEKRQTEAQRREAAGLPPKRPVT